MAINWNPEYYARHVSIHFRQMNELAKKGMLFSYATAHSFVTASKAAAGLFVPMSIIIYNGAFIVERMTQNMLHAKWLLSEWNSSGCGMETNLLY